MAPKSPRKLRRILLVLLLLGGVSFRARIFLGLPRELTVCTSDFAAFYAGGKLAGSADIYSPRAVFAAEQQAMGCYMENIIFIKPPFYASLMWPLAQLPFVPAIAIWRALGLAAIGLFLWMWPGDRLVAAAACAWSLPLASNFTAGQDVAFVLAAAIGAIALVKKGRHAWSGVLLGLCAIKFHLFLLLPVFLWKRRLWRVVLGGAVVGAAFLGLSFAGYGWSWPRQYWLALHDPRMDPYPWNMVNLNGLFNSHPAWVIPAAALTIMICSYLIVRGGLLVGISAVLAGGVLITPHNTASDGVLFLPLLLLAQKSRYPLARTWAFLGVTPLYVFLPYGILQVIVLLVLAATAIETRNARAADDSCEAGVLNGLEVPAVQ